MGKGHQEPQAGWGPPDIQPLVSWAMCLVAVSLNTDIFPGQKERNFCQAGDETLGGAGAKPAPPSHQAAASIPARMCTG